MGAEVSAEKGPENDPEKKAEDGSAKSSLQTIEQWVQTLFPPTAEPPENEERFATCVLKLPLFEMESSAKGAEESTEDPAKAVEESADDSAKAAEESAEDSAKAVEESADDSTKAAEESAEDSAKGAEESSKEETAEAKNTKALNDIIAPIMAKVEQLKQLDKDYPPPQKYTGWKAYWLDMAMTEVMYYPKGHDALYFSQRSPPSPWKQKKDEICDRERCHIVCESDNVIVVRVECEDRKTFRFYYSHAEYYVGKYKPNGSSYPSCLDHNLVIGGKKYCVTRNGVEVGPEEVWAASSAKFELVVTPWED